MKYLSSDEIRTKFVEYFKNHGHTHVPSSSLIPEGKDLLFTNAGMNQFKDIFLGLKKPSYKKAVTVQKCFRANDLDQVGRTPRHHTFFEMLGNFSFGDYFKKEAIQYAWDFLTHPDHLGIDKNRLYVTVYDADDEAYDLWTKIWEKNQEEIGKSKYEFIKKDKDNFWEMGSTGPCGPCSEIFYNYGGQDVEIWNLVFTQFDKQTDDSKKELSNGPFIDTGAGLERLTAVVQGVESNFETDIFMGIFSYVLHTKLFSSIRKVSFHTPAIMNQRETIIEVLDSCKEDLLGYLKRRQREIPAKLAEILKKSTISDFYDLYNFYNNNFIKNHLIPMTEELQKAENSNLRKFFLNFICEELQRDRSLIKYENLQEIVIDKNIKQKDKTALYRLADHIRATVFLVKDYVIPSNEGRGYILKQILQKIRQCLEQVNVGLFSGLWTDNRNEDPYGLVLSRTMSFFVHFYYQEFHKEASYISTMEKVVNFILEQEQKVSHTEEQKEKRREKDYYKTIIRCEEEIINKRELEINKEKIKIENQKDTIEEEQKNSAQKTERHLIAEEIKKDSETKIEKELLKEIKQRTKKIADFKAKINQIEKEIGQTVVSEAEKATFDKRFNQAFKAQRPTEKALGYFAFELYQTHGLSEDSTKNFLQQKGLLQQEQVFKTAFDQALRNSQELSRHKSTQKYLTKQKEYFKSLAKQIIQEADRRSDRQIDSLVDQQFVGYDKLSIQTKILKLSNGQNIVEELIPGQSGFAVFDQTPFYAESGGQVGDQGEIRDPSGNTIADITDCQKYDTDIHFHTVIAKTNILKINNRVTLEVGKERRAEIAKHHTATHLLHAALRDILKEKITEEDKYGQKTKKNKITVKQEGSLVTHDHLRFDFTHSKALTTEEKSEIERQVNQHIANALPVTTKIMPLQEAKEAGALAFFGEKYPDKVRVLTIGNNKESVELCGGTHVTNTNEIQAFVITEEMSISAGVRRINALVGQVAIDCLLKRNRELIDAQREAQIDKDLSQWVKKNKQENKDLQKQVQKLIVSKLEADIDIDQLIAKATPIKGGQKIQKTLEVSDREHLRQIADKIKNKIQSGIVILSGKDPNKPPLIVAVTKNLTNKYNAVDILREYGKGGGRPDFAQGFKLS